MKKSEVFISVLLAAAVFFLCVLMGSVLSAGTKGTLDTTSVAQPSS